MTIAAGVFKAFTVSKQTGLGVPKSGAGGTSIPRVTSTLNLKKDQYQSNTIKASQQRSDSRHGAKSVDGTLSGELNVGTHQLFEASVMRQAWQVAATTGAILTVTAAVTSPQFVDSGAGFITAGVKVGDVIRWTGFVATANNGKNFLITALTTTDMTGVFLNGDAVTAEAEGASVTGLLAGKKTYVPATAHTRDYYTIEHWHTDISQSELFTDCMVAGMNVKLPPTGMATVDFPIMGLGMSASSSQVLTSPTEATEAGNIASVNGAVYIGGVAVALLTGLDISVTGNYSVADPNVGSDTRADVFPGVVTVTGNASVYFQDATMRDYFIDETTVSIVAAFTASNDADAPVKVYVIPKVKMGGADKDDGEKGLTLTMPFTADEMTGSTNYVNSTISIQDSSAV